MSASLSCNKVNYHWDCFLRAVAVAHKIFFLKNFKKKKRENFLFSPLPFSFFFALCPRSQLTGRREGRVGRTMGVRCRDCGRESRLEPQCLERPSTPLIQLLFSCKSYQHFLLTPTITPHSWALFSLFTAHQGEGRARRQRDGAEEGKEK